MEGRLAAALQDASPQLIIQRLGFLYLFSSSSCTPLSLATSSPSVPVSACLPPRSLQVGFELPTLWLSSCFECKYSLPALSASSALSISSAPLSLFPLRLSFHVCFLFQNVFLSSSFILHQLTLICLFWLVRPKLTPPLFYLKNSWNMYSENCKARKFVSQVWSAAVSHPPNPSAARKIARPLFFPHDCWCLKNESVFVLRLRLKSIIVVRHGLISLHRITSKTNIIASCGKILKIWTSSEEEI